MILFFITRARNVHKEALLPLFISITALLSHVYDGYSGCFIMRNFLNTLYHLAAELLFYIGIKFFCTKNKQQQDPQDRSVSLTEAFLSFMSGFLINKIFGPYFCYIFYALKALTSILQVNNKSETAKNIVIGYVAATATNAAVDYLAPPVDSLLLDENLGAIVLIFSLLQKIDSSPRATNRAQERAPRYN